MRMMGTKVRLFGPLTNVSLEDLVPDDHFYRHLERSLDLAFVRDLVQPCYAAGGRPSVDPVVFFRLQLIMFFEGIRSERQLMRGQLLAYIVPHARPPPDGPAWPDLSRSVVIRLEIQRSVAGPGCSFAGLRPTWLEWTLVMMSLANPSQEACSEKILFVGGARCW